MDLRVKIGCFLNNIVVIAPKILVLSQNSVESLHFFLASRKWPFLKEKIWKITLNPEHRKIQSLL